MDAATAPPLHVTFNEGTWPPLPLVRTSAVWMPPLPLLCVSRSTRVPSHHRLSFASPPLAFDQGDTKTGSIVTQQPAVTFAALILLQQLKGHFPSARGSSGHWFSLYTPNTASSFSNTTSPVPSRSHDPNATIHGVLRSMKIQPTCPFCTEMCTNSI